MSQCSGVSSSIIGGLSSFPSTSGPSGPFSPTDLPNLVLWLDATDPANNGTKPANGSPLSTWVDKSPEGYIASQTTGARQPIFTTNVQNGLPCVVTTAASAQNMSISEFSATARTTIFIAVKQSTAGSNQFLLEQSADAAINNGFWVFGAANASTRRNTNLVTAVAGSNSWLGSSFTYVYSIYDGNNLNVFLKTALVATVTNNTLTNNTITTTLNICSRANSSLFSNASVGEILIYNDVLSASNITLIQNYLTTKWAIP